MAHANPATVRRIFADGHTIGTHSQDHPLPFDKLPRSLVEYEIDRGIANVEAALGETWQVAPFFRVPGLAHSDLIDSELAARHLVSFSSDTVADDWHHRIHQEKSLTLLSNGSKRAEKGILFLHDIHEATVAALPGLLNDLKDHGFHIVHVVPSSIDRF